MRPDPSCGHVLQAGVGTDTFARMRIVAGTRAGMTLVSPGARVRATAEAARVLCVEMVADILDGAVVLDLFAGSGAVGLEMLSRGAARCDFVEDGPAALHALKANVAAFRAKGRCRIFRRDAIPFVERLPAHRYDIAFADPPYGSRKLERVVERWQTAPFSRVLLIEHAADHIPGVRGVSRRYEDTRITLLQ